MNNNNLYWVPTITLIGSEASERRYSSTDDCIVAERNAHVVKEPLVTAARIILL